MKKYLLIMIVIFHSIQYAKCNEMIITEPEKIVVSVCDIARNSGIFHVEIKNKGIKCSLEYISTNNFCWTVKQITDIDSCTQKYLRESIYDFFVMNKKKYKYYHCCPVKILKYHLSSNSRNSVLDIQALI